MLPFGALIRAQQMVGAMERCLDHALALRDGAQAVRPADRQVPGGAARCWPTPPASTRPPRPRADLAAEAYGGADFDFAVAVAKARAGEAAGKVAEVCHQVHGAMGFTQEHPLHFATRRLWSWRDEFGHESFWQERIGRLVCSRGGERGELRCVTTTARVRVPVMPLSGRHDSARSIRLITNLADGPLTGIRILDLTSVIMGPFATHILADLGADVIKVESPEGDSVRHYQPQRQPGHVGQHPQPAPQQAQHRARPQARGVPRARLNRLIETADVFVHNLRPKAIERLGYGYEQVRAIKPDIVYCGAYGFGAKGPYGDKAAYDDLIQAGSGVAALYGAGARRAGLRAHRDLRQARRPGHRLCDPRRAVAARARRRRPGDRGADAGDHHRASTSSSTCAGSPSSRRSASPASRA